MGDRKKEIGRRIARLMIECGIASRKELSDLIKEEASKADPPEKGVTSTTVGRWISGQDEPKSSSLTFLAKALNVSADLILYGDDFSLRDIVMPTKPSLSDLIQAEVKKVLADTKSDLEAELAQFQKSKKIPPEDKEIIIAQIRRLLKRYEELNLDESESDNTRANDRHQNKE